ncbi:MAG: acetoacetate--CoA ligase [Bacteroidetes bacterium]|nr:MAG: acetoacetate--CoA ligase [Bacteroidota bacterium]
MTNLPPICFEPSTAFREASHLHHYQQWLTQRTGRSFEDYQALWRWSVEELEEFWASLWDYFEIIAHHPYEEVMSADAMPNTQWFKGATLNYTEHLFRHRSSGRPALIFANEQGENMTMNWSQLSAQVAAVQQYLLAQGIGPGDRVVAYLPNTPEAIISFMAVNGLGAVWSCCSPDFGVQTVIERFEQIEPSLLIAADGYRYHGKPFDRRPQVEAIRAALTSLRASLFLSYLQPEASLTGATNWAEVQAQASPQQEVIFRPVPFEHPIWVLYSSGTTGRPKAITHSHGGVLLEHLKYLHFHNDVHPGEHFFWFTTTGWMMWNFLQASMLAGGIPVLYDGSPGYPDLNGLWSLAQDLPIHHFGTSAPYLTTCMRRGLTPGKNFDLGPLRSIGSTGAPLPPEAFDWVYEQVKADVWLCSMSGGTDVCTAFVGGNPCMPVYRGLIQARALGCALYAYDEQGQRVVGSLGEMVIEKPMPSMPIYFWNDPEQQRYRQSYFSKYPGKWRHGDWIKIYENGSLLIQGRSDATLNRKGIRIGTAEIYNVLAQLPGIEDSLVLNLERPDGNDVMPLFVKLSPGQKLNEQLIQLIRSELRQQCSPRHVPDHIIAVPDIPYTLSGKKMEVPVKKVFLGMDIDKNMNRDAIRNPEAMAYFIELARHTTF